MNKRLKKKKGLLEIDPKELYSLDITLAKYILPRLIKFKKINTMSYPTEFNNIEEWHKVINKMIWSFDKHLKNDFQYKNITEEYKTYMEGLHLFAEYFGHLWD